MDTPVKRAQWGSQWEFFLTMVSYAVGIGNVYRFPYLCYKNGGGAFLIPYGLMLALVGIPAFYLELAMGQYAGKGPTKVFSFSPIFKGVGWAMILTTAVISSYYNVLCGYCFYYLVMSMTSVLPWVTCSMGNGTWADSSCMDIGIGNATINSTGRFSPSEQYFYHHVLEISKGVEEAGTIPWHLALVLAVSWIIVGGVLAKGVTSLGKFVYITATFPYIMITILLINNCLQDGASEGISFYLNPVWSKLREPTVWADAATQIFFSLSVCYGGNIAMASFNKFHNNVYRDAVIVSVLNSFTSFYAGLTIFSALGHMAHVKDISVAKVATQGPELAFVAYPQALSTMPAAPLWSILFYLMMSLLGLGCQFSNTETVVVAIIDMKPNWFTKKKSIIFRVSIFVLLFACGLPEITQGGLYFLSITDAFAGGYPLLMLGFLECVAISWVYGIDRFSDNVKSMTGLRVNLYFRIMWKYITPVVLVALIISKAIYDKTFVYKGYIYKDTPYQYPEWNHVITHFMIAGPIVLVVAGAIHTLITNRMSDKPLIAAIKPSHDWGPQPSDDLKATAIEGNDSMEFGQLLTSSVKSATISD